MARSPPLTFGVWAFTKVALSLTHFAPLSFTESRLHTTHGADLPWHGMAWLELAGGPAARAKKNLGGKEGGPLER
jgi:hypothetical protein